MEGFSIFSVLAARPQRLPRFLRNVSRLSSSSSKHPGIRSRFLHIRSSFVVFRSQLPLWFFHSLGLFL